MGSTWFPVGSHEIPWDDSFHGNPWNLMAIIMAYHGYKALMGYHGNSLGTPWFPIGALGKPSEPATNGDIDCNPWGRWQAMRSNGNCLGIRCKFPWVHAPSRRMSWDSMETHGIPIGPLEKPWEQMANSNAIPDPKPLAHGCFALGSDGNCHGLVCEWSW